MTASGGHRKQRVGLEDDPELDIDYVSGEIKHQAGTVSDRICFFTLRAGPLCSHHFIILPPEAADLRGLGLKKYVFEHMTHAHHTRTCHNVRQHK